MTNEEMYLANENLIYFMAQTLYITPDDLEYEDVISEGRMGLWSAITSYDESKGAFSTYACNIIQRRMWAYLKSKAVRDNRMYHANGISLDESINEDVNSGLLEILDVAPNTDSMLRIYLNDLRTKLTQKSVQVFFDYFDGMSVADLNAKYNLRGKMYCRYVALGREILRNHIEKDLQIERAN